MADVGGRYATIVANNDGKDEISVISLMEGTEPEFNVDAVDRGYKLEKAEDGWQIGMVRGGDVKAVGGFGFEDELSAAGRSDTGVTRIADTRTADDKSALSSVSHEKQRGLSAPETAKSGETRPAAARTTAASTGETAAPKLARRSAKSRKKAA